MNWRCLLTGHDWRYSELPPAERSDKDDRARRCRRCGKTERVGLFPGFAGWEEHSVEPIDPPSRYDRFFRPE